MNSFIDTSQRYKKYYSYLLIIILCIPLLFINVKNSHDWGDDFAQYIHQAKNIIEGTPQSSTGYVLNKDYPILGPPAYPIGFPLLLSPVYYLFGNNIQAFSIIMSIMLIAAAVLFLKFFKLFFSALSSVFLVLIIIYNPWTLNFKMEIMSDIPFTLCLYLLIILYHFRDEKRNYLFYFLIGLLGGFLISIRSAGIIFIIAISFEFIFCIYQYQEKRIQYSLLKKLLLQKIIMIFSAIFIYSLLNIILFKTPSMGFLYYTSALDLKSISYIIHDNLTYNFLMLKNFFEFKNIYLQFLSVFTQSALLTLTVIGFIKKVIINFDFIDLILILYCITVLIYPYSDAGFRFIFPIAPILFYYAVIAIKDFFKTANIFNRKYIPVLIGLIILIQYIGGIEKIIRNHDRVLFGPQNKYAAEALNYIKTSIPDDAIIEFEKPRAIALYTGKNGFHIKINQPITDIKKNFDKVGISYILQSKRQIDFIGDDSLKKYLSYKNDNIECIWSNYNFRLYKILK
ncbi:MAG TPA: hypothetical protein PKK00_05905 [Bacteroidales bacterium]|nr:hypothetical protein [Bacteroidales bacterium]HPS16834.1 hypothetical protein [Bacteroidales bacterium]